MAIVGKVMPMIGLPAPTLGPPGPGTNMATVKKPADGHAAKHCHIHRHRVIEPRHPGRKGQSQARDRRAIGKEESDDHDCSLPAAALAGKHGRKHAGAIARSGTARNVPHHLPQTIERWKAAWPGAVRGCRERAPRRAPSPRRRERSRSPMPA